jgi:hypothetical protein
MKRIILHWTAGTHTPNGLDLSHYHFVINGAGNVLPGKHPVHASAAPIRGAYAAHTRGANSDSIGVALAAMAGAKERPFSAGKYPITPAQVEALVKLVRKLSADYKIPVTRQTVLSHAEVQPTLGIKQSGKWDIAWLPGMAAPGDPVKVGDHIRGLINAQAAPKPPQASPAPPQRPVTPAPTPAPPKPAQSLWQRILAALGL